MQPRYRLPLETEREPDVENCDEQRLLSSIAKLAANGSFVRETCRRGMDYWHKLKRARPRRSLAETCQALLRWPFAGRQVWASMTNCSVVISRGGARPVGPQAIR